MRITKRIVAIVMVFLLCTPFLGITVDANSPPSAEFVEEDHVFGIIDLFLLPFIMIPGMVLTAVSESFVAALFRMDAQQRKIVRRTNVLSQLLMWSMYVVLYAALSMDVLPAITMLETAVYLGEFLVYRFVLKTVPIKRILIYTFTANTVSLILGIGLNLLLFHR